MKTPICPTCGCSLVRLGIRNDQATVYRTNGDEYRFCCQGCVDLFITDPRKHLKETKDMIVCPTCLAFIVSLSLSLVAGRWRDRPPCHEA